MTVPLPELPAWIVPGAVLTGVLALALIAHQLLFLVAERPARRNHPVVQSALRRSRWPTRIVLLLLSAVLVLDLSPVPEQTTAGMRHAVALGLIASFTWLVVAMSLSVEDLVDARLSRNRSDNLGARRIKTRLGILRRMSTGLLVFLAAASMLMTFPSVRHLGVSLLASAGLAGVIVGLAAQRTIGNVIAGLQIAWSQPIRLDDVVVVEGEWGWVEEIGWTHVVIRLWDLRHLVVPLSYFLEKPFQNWTRQKADILGTVTLYVDYTVPVAQIRQALREILVASGKWDGVAWALEVTSATERAIELRALMSAPDSTIAWELRCHVREKLVEFLQKECPDSLPKTRTLITAEQAPDHQLQSS